jgi:hypothetical protein
MVFIFHLGVFLLGKSENVPHAVADTTGKQKQKQQKKIQRGSKDLVWQNVYNSEVRVAW